MAIIIYVTCTQDWSACEPHTILGLRATLLREYFRNGEFHMSLVMAGMHFESPSIFWTREEEEAN